MAREGIRPGQSGTRAVRRVAQHWIGSAARALQAGRVVDADVHEARKQIKKSRAAVRLLREALGEMPYRRENTALRAAARPLNAIRDSGVLLPAVDSLRERYPALAHDVALIALRRRLHSERLQARQQLRVAPVYHALREAQRRSKSWPVGKHGWSMLGPAFKRVYAAGRRAARAARASPDDLILHEWRKQVKYLLHALQILEPLRPKVIAGLIDQADRLGDSLGEDHDLALLRMKTLEQSHSDQDRIEPLLAAIDRRRRTLQARSAALGRRLYRRGPRLLTARFERYWREWRRSQQGPQARAPIRGSVLTLLAL